MRITEGIIYLAQPVFGRRRLTGATWVDYTFTDTDTGTHRANATDPLPDADAGVTPPHGWRVLIPITNVTAVVIGSDDTASGRGSGLP
jgi:hypothetical protein